MASRRARLKAVANLPVRRKAGAAEETSEPVKVEKTVENPVHEDVSKKNQEVEEKENSAVSDIKTDATAEVVTLEPEIPKEPEEKKEEKKPAGPAKFNRRLKPVVNLPVRKERVPAGESEKKEVEARIPIEIPDPVNKLIESSSPELKNVPENPPEEKISVIVKPSPPEAEIKSPEKIVNTPQSPVKATQRPVFLRPNIDVNFLRPSDEPKPMTRVRNISESSNTSVIVQNNAQNDGNSNRRNITSILKRKRPKSNDLTRKMADARREFHRRYEKIKPDRSSLRMIDLIFYNPTTNPMISKNKCEKKENQPDEEIIAEEKVDDPDALDSSKTDDDMDDENLSKMPVPQVKIGLNGEIILDEKSLVIETTDAKKGREDLQNSVPVFEDRSTKMSYYCRKSKKSKDWTDSETKRFYKALNTIGTDFLLMQQIFPNRSRLELKNKFKREEKLNRSLVDKALTNPSEFDMTQLEKDLEDEKRIEEEETELKLQKKIKPKTIENKNRPRSSLQLETDSEMNNGGTPDDPLQFQKRSIKTEKIKKIKEADMLFEKFMFKKPTKTESEAPLTEKPPGDQNSNLPICNDFNIKDYKTRRKDDAMNSETIPEPADGENTEAMDLSVKKFPEKKISRKRKVEKIERKKKRRKKEALVYPPDVEENIKKEDHVVTRTITDQDFFQLLAANVNNMKDSNIKVQVTEDYSPGSKEPGKKIEIIFDEVPPITLKEIEDQNIKVLADYNHTICEDESPQSPEESDRGCKETSVIVKNPNVVEKIPPEEETEPEEVENENCMLVIDEEGDQGEYQYMMVEQEVEEMEEVVENSAVEEVGQNVDVENLEAAENIIPSPALIVTKNPKTNAEKMCIAGLSAGSFVLMSSDQQKEKKLSMFMISEKSQADGSSVLSSMPVMLPPELLSSLTQELDCS